MMRTFARSASAAAGSAAKRGVVSPVKATSGLSTTSDTCRRTRGHADTRQRRHVAAVGRLPVFCCARRAGERGGVEEAAGRAWTPLSRSALISEPCARPPHRAVSRGKKTTQPTCHHTSLTATRAKSVSSWRAGGRGRGRLQAGELRLELGAAAEDAVALAGHWVHRRERADDEAAARERVLSTREDRDGGEGEVGAVELAHGREVPLADTGWTGQLGGVLVGGRSGAASRREVFF